MKEDKYVAIEPPVVCPKCKQNMLLSHTFNKNNQLLGVVICPYCDYWFNIEIHPPKRSLKYG